MRMQFDRAWAVSLALPMGFAFLVALVPAPAHSVPSFARQLDMPCNGCHVQFPVLNGFGQQFKLSGYTLNAKPTIKDERAEARRKLLDLPVPALLSVMFQADYTRTGKRQPDSKNDDIEFPDQASLFFAGRIAPKVGSFVQVTYSGAEDAFGFDNTDIRIADTKEIASKPLVYGVSFNNNPTVSDPWNTTPAWGYPYASSPSAPTPAASALVNGNLAQEVAGGTVYGYFDELVYAEAGVYGAAPLGVDRPLAREGSLQGPIPYWRLALSRVFGQTSVMVGHFGLAAKQKPDGGGPNDDFTDVGLDFQVRHPLGPGLAQLQGRWVYEDARYGTGNAASRHGHLHQISVDATYFWDQWLSLTLSPFATFGSRDPIVYAPDAVDGSRNGRPDSHGLIAEVSYNPWMNTRLTLQYTSYFEFNGRRSGYDGSDRDASDNDTLFLQMWLAW